MNGYIYTNIRHNATGIDKWGIFIPKAKLMSFKQTQRTQILEICSGINEFKMDYQLRNNLLKTRLVI
jgi:hypothetical protein